jgi:hypothetical protein
MALLANRFATLPTDRNIGLSAGAMMVQVRILVIPI